MRIRYKAGIYHMIQAALALSLMSACSKLVTPYVSVFIIVFYRSVIGCLLLSPFAIQQAPKLIGFSTHDWVIITIRNISGFAALCCFFYAIGHLQLATAVVLNYTSPIFIALLSAWLLKENISLLQAILTITSFVGVYIVMAPYIQFDWWPAFMGVLSGFLTAVAYVSIRFLSGSVANKSIVFYFTLTSSLFALPFLLPNWTWPPRHTWIPLLGVGLLAYIGQIKLTSAFIKAPASLVSNFGYLNVVFAAFWGLIFWQEPLRLNYFIGAALIIGSGILLRKHYQNQASK